MNHKLFTTLSSLSISSALLVVGLMPGGHAAGQAAGPQGGVVETIEAGALEAADDMAPAPRRHRRGRASLSMPYFSFAQSLRPQG
ncbi:hypothetical protein DT603_00225 [Pseudoxanthomonas gei]|uniref:Uncharacterized protein n=1 Tax=Pseudoxanthomonas gei TaxID=1383030 RepID=A0ABX0A9L1_9GAMM|nr:hypothetical protein [Pseudoxanthomonas gei]NDK37270.1 hypothetical protein [Pseudoxanthomonas gei]